MMFAADLEQLTYLKQNVMAADSWKNLSHQILTEQKSALKNQKDVEMYMY
jgi:hypothetical protein